MDWHNHPEIFSVLVWYQKVVCLLAWSKIFDKVSNILCVLGALRAPKVRIVPRGAGTRAEFTSQRTGGLGRIASGENERAGGTGALPETDVY